MIFSPENKFLMIKNYKVGGTSVEVELSKIFSDKAIVTPIIPINKKHTPRNHSGFYNFIPYSEIKNKLDLTGVKVYTIMRNPYSIVLSDFFSKVKMENFNIDLNTLNKKDIDKNLISYFKNPINSTKFLYTEYNKVCIDDFLIYENGLENELNRILFNHKIDKIKIKTFEKQYKPKNINIEDVFSKNHIDIINDLWSWEFDYFKYERL
jgi:hypothetical protein